MITGIDIKQRIEFVSKNDLTEPKTVFVLRPLSSLEMMEFSEKSNQSQAIGILFYLEKSIVEVKNFATQDIKEVIQSINVGLLGELIIAINKLNNVSGEEAKNS